MKKAQSLPLLLLAAAGILLPCGTLKAESNVSLIPVDVSYEMDSQEGANGRWVYTTGVRVVSEDPETPEGLVNALAEYSDSQTAYAEEQMTDFLSWLEEEPAPEEDDYMQYFLKHDLSVTRADTRVISFCDFQSSFTGGAHPNSWYETRNYDSLTGRLLSLQDVLKDPDSLPELLEEVLKEDIYPEAFLYDDLAAAIRDEMEMSGTYTDEATGEEAEILPGPDFTLSYDSITFWFSPYEITSHAAGAVSETLRFEDYPDLVKEEYTEVPEDWMVPVSQNQEVTLSDGSVISWQAYPLDEYESEWNYILTVNGVNREETVYAFEFHSWLIHQNGRNFLATESAEIDDYVSMKITDLNGLTGITSPEEIPEGTYIGRHFMSSSPTDPNQVILGTRADLLSTYTVYRTYRFGEDGLPEALEDWDTVRTYDDWGIELTVRRRLGVDTVDASGEITGSLMLPEGTKLHFWRTDGNTWVDMITDSDETVRLYTDGEWPQKVNGLDAEEYLDGMMFAG